MCKTRRMLIRGVLCLLCVTLASTAWSQAEPKVVRVGVFQVEPLTYVRDGKPEGLFIDILEEVAARRGWKLQYDQGTFDAQFAKLIDGESDVMLTIAWSAERTAIQRRRAS
jgi:ABC-type amino acid transport substrate-binding protein